MSNVDPDTPNCLGCGEPMKPATATPDGPGAAQAWYCGNPACPRSEADLAPLADPQEWLDTPGSEGGANGGA